MARPKNTPEKIENMRNAMMDAVISLLDEVSPDKVSIRMIAEKVGVSHMVFYTYFKDRDEIMRVVLEREKKNINDHFTRKLEEAKTKTTKTVINELLHEYAGMAKNHPRLFRLFWMDTNEKKKRKTSEFNHMNESFPSMAKILKNGMDKGEFVVRDERLASATVMALINAPIIMNHCKKLPPDISCEKILGEIIKAIFAYLET